MFTLPNLPYTYKALEPHIDEETMHLHHDKHHQTYVDKLNAAVDGDPVLAAKSIEDILSDTSKIDPSIKNAVINHGGGHLNHSFFWTIMGPDAPFDPESSIAKDINKTFGSFEEFKKLFTEKAINRFGSGWAWLVVNEGKLEIMDTLNQDTPISVGKVPLLCVDVWEHAYYLKYQNKRADYVTAWWNVINWKQVEENYQKATKK